jgi:MerR family transcriptional regulator, light-induced transcriptional regulator
MQPKGIHRIQAVSALTGIPAPTLRAWQRRYGLPEPARSASGYRLYSDDDVALIRHMRELVDKGVAPAEAARIVRAKGRAAPIGEAESLDAFALVRRRILDAVAAFEPLALAEGVQTALCLGSAQTIFEEVFAPVMVEVGERWHAGTLSVAQEHLASEAVETAVRDLLRLVQPDGASREALLACFEEEDHVLPLYGVAFRLVQWGFRTTLLGARLPPADLAHAVSRTEPDLVALTVTAAPAGRRATSLVNAYGAACARTPWIVGGQGAAALADRIREAGGEVGGANLQALHAQVDRLCRGREGR